MGYHYNAFISYRHCPRDSAVAAEVQRRLERLRIPGAITKKTGVKRIDRVFRDKEELPITSALSDNIAEALENSDYLIVICSVHTGESYWVEKEIQLFLKNHSVDKVLTVLSEGEPENIIPKCLFEYTDPETGETIPRNFEPLSCDWRDRPRRVIRDELPRIAALLIGCSYDELRQRQRQYRARRLTAALSSALALLLGLTVYYIRTSAEIKRNYDEAMRNQSKYLAAASDELYKGGDRLTAIQLAMMALPSDTQDRPLVAEAEFALSQAVCAYVPRNSSRLLASGAFVPDSLPQQFSLSEDGSLLIIQDVNFNFTVWDTDTFQQRCSFRQTEDTYNGNNYLIYKNDLIIWWTSQRMHCGSLRDGSILWTAPGAASARLSLDGEQIISETHDYDSDEFYLILSDVHTGTELKRIRLPLKDSEVQAPPSTETDGENAVYDEFAGPADKTLLMNYYLKTRSALSEDGRYLAVPFCNGDNNYCAVCRVDLVSGEIVVLDAAWDCVNIVDLCFLDDDSLLVLRSRGSVFGTIIVGDDMNLAKTPYSADLLSVSENRLIWSYPFNTYKVATCGELLLFEDKSCVQVAVSDKVFFLDPQKGSLIADFEAPAPIVAASENSFFDSFGNGLEYNYEVDKTVTAALLPRNLEQVTETGNKLYYLEAGADRIVAMSWDICDESWQYWDAGSKYVPDCFDLSGDYLATLEGSTLRIYGVADKALLRIVDLDEYFGDYVYADYFGFARSGLLKILTDQKLLLSIDPESGTLTETAMAELFPLGEGSLPLGSWSSGGKDILYAFRNTRDGAVPSLYLYDIGTGTAGEYGISSWAGLGVYPSHVIASEKAALLQGQYYCYDENGTKAEESLVILDRETGETAELDCEVADYMPVAAWNNDSTMLAVVSGDYVRLYSPDGSAVGEIFIGGLNPESVCFSPDSLYVLLMCSEDGIYRYEINGRYDGRAELEDLRVPRSGDESWQFPDPDTLVIRSGYSDEPCSVVLNWSQLCVTATVERCFGYDAGSGQFITYDGDCGVGAFRRHSVEELVRMGLDTVGDAPVRESVLSAYGIRDLD